MTKKTWTTEEINELLKLMYTLDVVSLNTLLRPENSDDNTDTELGSIIADSNQGPQEILESKERLNILLKFVEKLPPRQMQVIKLRYGLDDGIPKTLDEVGAIYGVTRERIRQVENKALRKLRWLITVKGKYRDINEI